MKILELQVSDLKRISAIEINPTTGKPVVLTGDNGNGKSSILDSIVFALTNNGLDDPIRHGRPAGQVRIVLGQDKAECTIERRVTKKGTYLTVLNAEGLKIDKAQTFLNGLLGNYAFDPLEFTRLKPKQQVEALKEAAGLNFDELDAKRAVAYARRTEVGRAGKEVAAQLQVVPEPVEGTPDEEVSASNLVDELRGLEDATRHLASVKERVVKAIDKEEAALREIDRLKALLKAAENHQTACATEIDEAQKAMKEAEKAAPTADQIEAARNAIAQVDQTNRAIRNARKWKELTERVTELRATYATLDREIEAVDEEKARLVSETALPLDGLEFTEEGVMYRGTFFNQLSTAEQIRISTLVAMAQNPTLRIVMIREGALINTENMKMIAELAESEDFQLWIEKFQEQAGDVGLHIVDGAVAFVDGEEVQP